MEVAYVEHASLFNFGYTFNAVAGVFICLYLDTKKRIIRKRKNQHTRMVS